MGRKEDLESHIRESYELVRQSEAIVRETDRPKERKRAEREIDEQWGLIRGYLDEYIPLCKRLQVSIANDLVDIVARFPKYADRHITVTALPTGQTLATAQPPHDLRLLPSHLYLESGTAPGGHVLSRERDGQDVLYLPACGKVSQPFLIDKYLVTNAQYAAFLNATEVRAQTYIILENNVRVVTTLDGQTLAADARSYWEVRRQRGAAWGLTFESDVWEPLPDSAQLPVTLVTALGASWYAAWANKFAFSSWGAEGQGLPTEGQWITVALWDYAARRLRAFPWGDVWDRSRLNSVAYWAGREFVQADREYEIWLKNVPPTHRPRPTPVGDFPAGASPSGMMDAFGNVWEWLADRDPADKGRQMIIGGACTSPQSVFRTATPIYRQSTFLSEVIGFRCCRQVD